jgi:hypothetical protein
VVQVVEHLPALSVQTQYHQKKKERKKKEKKPMESNWELVMI